MSEEPIQVEGKWGFFGTLLIICIVCVFGLTLMKSDEPSVTLVTQGCIFEGQKVPFGGVTTYVPNRGAGTCFDLGPYVSRNRCGFDWPLFGVTANECWIETQTISDP